MDFLDFLSFNDRSAYVSVVKYGNIYKFIYHKHSYECSGLHTFKDNKNTNDTKLNNNISRAKNRVFELAMCNDWQYFVTLTLNDLNIDRFNLNEAVKRFGEWVGNYNKKFNTKLKYLLVPEQHKNGAWHFHGLFSGIAPDSLIKNNYGYLDIPYFVHRFGFVSLSPIKDHNRTASYITKYVTKDMTANNVDKNKHLFYASRGLNSAVLVSAGRMDSKLAHELCTFENEHCGIAFIDEAKLQQILNDVF